MLEDLRPPKRKATCKVATLAQGLSDKDKEILLAAVADSVNWKIKPLETELKKRGLMISDTPLIAHRAQNCSCFRDA
jgi:hypothetical protein